MGRAIAGLGASGITNGVLAMVAASVPMAQRPTIIGFGMASKFVDQFNWAAANTGKVSQVGTVLGPLLGGILTEDME